MRCLPFDCCRFQGRKRELRCGIRPRSEPPETRKTIVFRLNWRDSVLSVMVNLPQFDERVVYRLAATVEDTTSYENARPLSKIVGQNAVDDAVEIVTVLFGGQAVGEKGTDGLRRSCP